MSALLNVKDLQVSYGGINAVKGIDLQVHRGELVALIGANGAGKSSTLKAIAGLLTPSAGEIEFASKQTKKSLQAPRTKRQPNRVIAKTGVRTSTSERSDRRSAASKSPFERAAAVKSAAPKKRVLRADAAESKIGWSSPGYRKAIAAPAPIKKRKVRMSSTKKKSLGS